MENINGGDLMSKKPRRRKKRPLKDDIIQVTAPKFEPQAETILKDEAKPLVDDALIAPDLPKDVQIEAILKEAPMLPWEIDKTYIATGFRKAYVALLKKLVKLYGLPYNVDQTGVLTRIV